MSSCESDFLCPQAQRRVSTPLLVCCRTALAAASVELIGPILQKFPHQLIAQRYSVDFSEHLWKFVVVIVRADATVCWLLVGHLRWALAFGSGSVTPSELPQQSLLLQAARRQLLQLLHRVSQRSRSPSRCSPSNGRASTFPCECTSTSSSRRRSGTPSERSRVHSSRTSLSRLALRPTATTRTRASGHSSDQSCSVRFARLQICRFKSIPETYSNS